MTSVVARPALPRDVALRELGKKGFLLLSEADRLGSSLNECIDVYLKHTMGAIRAQKSTRPVVANQFR